ncbi:unnamed protein product [Symbiodinium natans]|uniref:Knr4/Smi1-like domain-containing protein n=1 Tax=Symbiodinium natans TaxID=878477 RepID=A0A812QMK4_9DINO|nr:unnamed protein product [Symbiodinium natans]
MFACCEVPTVDVIVPEPVSLEAVKLGGENAWGPQFVHSGLTCDELRRGMAADLDVRWRSLQLVAGERRLEGPQTLEDMGFVEGKYQVQMVLQDNSAEIRHIQEAIVKGATADKVSLTEGLSDDEVDILEKKYGFRFPPEFLEFLQAGVLVGGGWHDWHTLASRELEGEKDTVAWIIKCHCTPEEDDYYYLKDWCPPEEKSMEKAVEYATKVYPVIPMRIHRCICTVPHTTGLPVLSMHQMSDNIQYGNNFWDWVARDTHLPEGTVPEEWKAKKSIPLEEVPFWQHWNN